MKALKITFYLSTALLTALMLFSVYNYYFNYPQTTTYFVKLGYPIYLIHPLALAKLSGLIVIWFLPRYKSLLEWVYAGFFFNFVLAFFAHFLISDGSHLGAFMAILMLMISYFSQKRIKR